MIVTPQEGAPWGAPLHRLRRSPPHTRDGRSGVCGSRMTCLGPDREGLEITSGRSDAQGLTFSAVIPARARQPEGSTGVDQKWLMALCGYGMAFAPRHRGHLCGSHQGRTSAVRTGSGDPWPDSVGGEDLGWLPGLPSSSKYAPFRVAVARWSACSRTTRNPVSATPHRLPRHHCCRDRCAPGAAAPGHGHRSRSRCSDTGVRREWCHRGSPLSCDLAGSPRAG